MLNQSVFNRLIWIVTGLYRVKSSVIPPFFIISFFLITSFTSQGQQYQVGLQNGKLYSGSNIRWKTPFLGKEHLLINDSLKISMDQISFYEVQEGYYKKFASPKTGYIDFYKREVGGERINVFTVLVSTGSYNPATGMYIFNQSKVYWYEKDRNALKKLSYKNLKYDLSDNQASMYILKKVNDLRIATGLVYALGAGLIIAGIADGMNQDVGTTSSTTRQSHSKGGATYFIGGAVCMVVPLVINIGKRKKIFQAIELYNTPLRN